jgi:ABC-type glycerol-3-phosphate transport system permease component
VSAAVPLERPRGPRWRRFVPHVLLGLVVAVNLFPIYYMVVSSLRPGGGFFVADRLLPPLDPVWSNYTTLFTEKGFARLFVNSTVITAVSVSVALVVSVLGAYAFTRLRSRAASSLYVGTVALLAVPPIVVLVPLFLLAARAGLINTFVAPIVIYVGFVLPFSVLMLRNYFEAIPKELLEAARSDGAGPLAELRHVVLPLSKAPILALAVVNGLWIWNELLIAIVFLQDDDLRTLQAGIAFFAGRNVADTPLILAGSLVATLPILLLFVFGQRYFVRGLTGGALKG